MLKRLFGSTFMMLALPLALMAQGAIPLAQYHVGQDSLLTGANLDYISFEDVPTRFVFPKENGTYYKTGPGSGYDNMPQKVAGSEYEGWSKTYELLGVFEEKNGWMRTQEGWIQANATRPAKDIPITTKSLNTKCFTGSYGGYDEGEYRSWIAYTPAGKHGFALAMSRGYIYLGRQVGNVLAFKYRIPLEGITYVPEKDEFIEPVIETNKGVSRLHIDFGKAFAVKLEDPLGILSDYALHTLDLSKFTDTAISWLFGLDFVEEGWLFLSQELFSKEYYENVPD